MLCKYGPFSESEQILITSNNVPNGQKSESFCVNKSISTNDAHEIGTTTGDQSNSNLMPLDNSIYLWNIQSIDGELESLVPAVCVGIAEADEDAILRATK